MAQHKWKKGDSFSSLAAAKGLATWQKIWEHPANQALRAKRVTPDKVIPGDLVEIPDIQLGEVSRPTEKRHQFVRIGVPPASIKFIRGVGDPKRASASRLDVLQVSAFVTTRQLPSGFLSLSTDPRNFKVEVFDKGATGTTINVELEAKKPVLDAKKRPKKDSEDNIEYESFSPKRTLSVSLKKVPGLKHIYRSQHLRLVTDNEDKQSKPNQTLLTDHDPNNLAIEILDQEVTARYTAVSGEPLATYAVVGENRLRVRCKAFVCRPTFGAANLVGGLKKEDVKRHILSWVRRTYAAANMSPLLIDTEVEPVDPVENMVWIPATSAKGARGGKKISFRVNTTPTPTKIEIDTVKGETPKSIIGRLKAAAKIALPNDYKVETFDNPSGIYNNLPSSDLLITHATQVIIDQPITTDAGMRVLVGRVRPSQNTTTEIDFMNIGSAENRAMARMYRKEKNALAIFVIDLFAASEGAVGFAFPRWFREVRRGIFPVFGSCFVEARTVSTADQMVHTTDHEMGHILVSMVHFSGNNTELMSDAPVNNTNSVTDSKRLSDRILAYTEFVRGKTRSFPLNPNSDIRSRERGEFMEDWDVFLNAP